MDGTGFLIRNSLKYVPTRDYKDFTARLKKIYGVASLKACRIEFERFCLVWAKYPDAIAVSTNAIETVNFSFRKVTNRGAFWTTDSLSSSTNSTADFSYLTRCEGWIKETSHKKCYPVSK